MLLLSSQQSIEWVKRLPDAVSALNNEVTRLTGKRPAATIKERGVAAQPFTPYSRSAGESEKKSPST